MESKTTVAQIIVVAEQRGYTLIGWGRYQKLLPKIVNLIGGNTEQGDATEPPGHVAHILIWIPAPIDSQQKTKALPKSSLTALTNCLPWLNRRE